MRIDDQEYLAILRIGYDTLTRGDGRSLHEELAHVGQTSTTLACKIKNGRVVRVLRAHPKVLQQWIRYAEKKPKDRGFWVNPISFELGSDEFPDYGRRCWPSLEEAIAEFIIRELAYWTGFGERNTASPVPPTVDEIVVALNQESEWDSAHAKNCWFNDHGVESLIPSLVAAFPGLRKWQARNAILFELIRFARRRPEVLQVALVGIKDSAYMVRMQACIMLAYSQRKEMIPHLKQILFHKDKKTREYAQAAIKHIRSGTVFYDF